MTVVQLAVTSVLSFLLVVPTQERIPDFSWLCYSALSGLGAASAAIPGGDELGAEECLADSGHTDLCR